jgi:endonuclease-3
VNGREISKDDVVRITNRVQSASRKLFLPPGHQLTFFEIATAIAFEYFREREVDFAVLETGMGGRLDATNACMPLVAVVTNIDYEHTEFLGNTLAGIAREKAGIIKPGCVAVTAESRKEPLEVIEKACRDKKVRLIRIGKDVSWGVVTNTLVAVHHTENELGMFDEPAPSTFSAYGFSGKPYESLSISLAGRHQIVNAVMAVAAIEALGPKGVAVPERAIRKGLANARIDSRFQVIHINPAVIIDNAHTPASAAFLCRTIEEFVKDRVVLIFGTSSDKDACGILKALAHKAKSLIITQACSDRAMSTEQILQVAKGIFPSRAIKIVPRIPDALKFALEQASKKGTIVVTGSTYVCGEALAHFRGVKSDGLTDSLAIKNSGKLKTTVNSCQTPEYIDLVFRGLKKLFGDWRRGGSELASQSKKEDPFRVLIATILSHRTRDENTHRATENLFKIYRTPKEIATAPVKKLEELVRPTGFYRMKAKNIKKVARLVWKKHHGTVPDNLDELLALPAVGRKTANCVLVYAFNKPAIPVDTHVHRISNRLGLVKTRTPEETETELSRILPKKYWLPINDYLVSFGKTICRPVSPKCGKCPLSSICPSSKKQDSKRASQ